MEVHEDCLAQLIGMHMLADLPIATVLGQVLVAYSKSSTDIILHVLFHI